MMAGETGHGATAGGAEVSVAVMASLVITSNLVSFLTKFSDCLTG